MAAGTRQACDGENGKTTGRWWIQNANLVIGQGHLPRLTFSVSALENAREGHLWIEQSELSDQNAVSTNRIHQLGFTLLLIKPDEPAAAV